LIREFTSQFGVQPLEGYGCTEVSPVVSTSIPDLPGQRGNRLGCIGQPLPGVAVRTFDPETRQELPIGTEGALGILGPNVMKGYWNDPERTRQTMSGGWYVSGDIGQVEADGFIRITGRLARFAKIAGEMIPLERIEDDLHELLQSAGERWVTLASVPDPKRGERLVLLHLAEVTARLPEVFEALRERGIPNLWIPDLRDCRVVDSFPALGSGKLDIRAATELAIQKA
jgi:acyl-[acyl-carrier-protein]-phospholipid O-acyltransferase/long-chain-fatty-acid--[acyl-carrier-protein] ligase